MDYIGKSNLRVDAYAKVTGNAKYSADLAPRDAYVAKVLHSTIANGEVVSMDVSEAKKVPGVIGVFTCFDVPDVEFPTAGHPWSVEESHQDIADRKLLNKRVRLYGDDIAAVVAEEALEYLDAPILRYGAPFTPIPFTPALEKLYRVYPEDLVKGIKGVL